MNDKKQTKKNTKVVAKNSSFAKMEEVPLLTGLSNIQLKEYCEFFDESGLEQLEIKSENFKLKLSVRKEETAITSVVANVPTAPKLGGTAEPVSAVATSSAEAESTGPVVLSPIVGTFYSKPNPSSEDFVKIGDNVVRGQVIGIVEAMKIMNEIESSEEGVVEAILVKNGEVISEGQKLLQLK